MKDLMRKHKNRIDRELAAFFDERIKRVNGMDHSVAEALMVLKEFSLRDSKRIRPMLTIFSYKGLGGKNESAIIKAALAVELMQSFLLIHDDIIDKDEMRRGYLTVHKIYENKSKDSRIIDPAHYGSAQAILIGDIACVLGSEALLSANFPLKLRLAAAEKFNRVVINTCFGQMLDVKSEALPTVTEDDINAIHMLKTAIYTIEGPLHIGAILAGAHPKVLRQLTHFAIPLGKAFQIRDDILGLYGTQEKIGKPVGSDVKEGKKTLLILKALKNGSSQQRAYIKNCLGNKKMTKNQFARLQAIVKESGSLEYSEKLMEQYVAQSRRFLSKIKMAKEGKEFLEWITEYIMERDK